MTKFLSMENSVNLMITGHELPVMNNAIIRGIVLTLSTSKGSTRRGTHEILVCDSVGRWPGANHVL